MVPRNAGARLSAFALMAAWVSTVVASVCAAGNEKRRGAAAAFSKPSYRAYPFDSRSPTRCQARIPTNRKLFYNVLNAQNFSCAPRSPWRQPKGEVLPAVHIGADRGVERRCGAPPLLQRAPAPPCGEDQDLQNERDGECEAVGDHRGHEPAGIALVGHPSDMARRRHRGVLGVREIQHPATKKRDGDAEKDAERGGEPAPHPLPGARAAHDDPPVVMSSYRARSYTRKTPRGAAAFSKPSYRAYPFDSRSPTRCQALIPTNRTLFITC